MAKDTKGKSGVPADDGEKHSPTDLQEIQMQMNATTDEVRNTESSVYNNTLDDCDTSSNCQNSFL